MSSAQEVSQDDLGDVIRLVTDHRGRETLVQRLRETHPSTKGHDEQYDQRLWDVVSEAAAFAWLAHEGYRQPRFCWQEGYPDLEVAENLWVEVKTVHISDFERREVREGIKQGNGALIRFGWMNKDPHPTLLKKFEDNFNNALTKFQRVDPNAEREAVVWMRVQGFDWPLSPTYAWRHIEAWAEAAVVGSGRHIVLVDGWNWDAPRYSTITGGSNQ